MAWFGSNLFSSVEKLGKIDALLLVDLIAVFEKVIPKCVSAADKDSDFVRFSIIFHNFLRTHETNLGSFCIKQ